MFYTSSDEEESPKDAKKSLFKFNNLKKRKTSLFGNKSAMEKNSELGL